MENGTPALDHGGAQRNVGTAREGSASLHGGHKRIKNEDPVHVTPIFDVPGTATSRGSSLSR